ncbi:MAG: exodeoxyribonuclease VII large subunit [Planctomycetota bacterium]
MAKRGLFDPSKMKGAGDVPPPVERGGDGDRPWSVSELAGRIDQALRSGLPAAVHVRGEVSGFRDRTHWYFDLKDGSSVVNAVMFASAARRSELRIENGIEVVARGRLEFYKPGGKVSLIVDRVEAVGAGALEARLKALVDELRGLGWLDQARKRPTPVFPRRVAVVTSKTGAALQDVIDTMRRRCAAVGLLVVDARVQGERAAPEVAAAIRALGAARERLGIEAILVTRGGGSMEDLWAFNERVVAEAIVESPVAVVAAIGHETDVTVAELVADARCATPTQAAVLLTPDRAALVRQLDSMADRVSLLVRRRAAGAREKVEALASRPVIARPTGVVEVQADRIDGLRRRLGAAARSEVGAERDRLASLTLRLERRRPAAEQARWAERLDQLEARLGRAARRSVATRRELLANRGRELAVVSPVAVLERGYSFTTDAQGRAVRSTQQATPGDSITTRVADGTFDSVVGGEAPTADKLTAKGPQLDLFGGTRGTGSRRKR